MEKLYGSGCGLYSNKFNILEKMFFEAVLEKEVTNLWNGEVESFPGE